MSGGYGASVAIIIPARYASTRLPGKPLLKAGGKPMIQHVYERAARAPGVDHVLVATDDDRIKTVVEAFGGDCVMTRADHQSGAERVNEAADAIDADIVINLQGDEPLFVPQSVAVLLQALCLSQSFAATLAVPFPTETPLGDPAAVKAVLGRELSPNVFDALYFTRAPAPFSRPTGGDSDRASPLHFLHLGVYAFRRPQLRAFTELRPGRLEQAEGLEQLRILEAGERIAVGVVKEAGIGVDTPADLAAWRAIVEGACDGAAG